MSEAVVALLATLLVLSSRRLGRRRTDAALLALALLAAVVHSDFLDFHGGGVFVHYHDAGHYYLGSKYFPELGYGGLYGALLVAEVESEGTNSTAFARDLTSGQMTTVEVVLTQGEAVRSRFSAERWQAFRQDADLFRQRLGPLFADFVSDHGFNPTPLWALGAGALAEQFPLHKPHRLLLLALLDTFLVTAMLVALWLAFGRRTALLAAIFLLIAFGGGNFDWIGGAYLRYTWLAALVLGIASLSRGHHAAAGVLVAFSTALRLFPGIFVLGALGKVAGTLLGGRRLRREPVRFLTAFTVTLMALCAVTLASPGHGLQAWTNFAATMKVYLGAMPYNTLGFHQVAESLTTFLPATFSNQATTILSRLAGLGCLTAALFLGRRKDEVSAAALGCFALYGLLEMAVYYSLVLVLLLIAHRNQPRALAWIFGVEAAAWGAAAVLGSGSATHTVHSLLLLFLFGVLYLDDLLDELPIQEIPNDGPPPRSQPLEQSSNL